MLKSGFFIYNRYVEFKCIVKYSSIDKYSDIVIKSINERIEYNADETSRAILF